MQILFYLIVYQKGGLNTNSWCYIKHMDASIGIGDEMDIKQAIIQWVEMYP